MYLKGECTQYSVHSYPAWWGWTPIRHPSGLVELYARPLLPGHGKTFQQICPKIASSKGKIFLLKLLEMQRFCRTTLDIYFVPFFRQLPSSSCNSFLIIFKKVAVKSAAWQQWSLPYCQLEIFYNNLNPSAFFLPQQFLNSWDFTVFFTEASTSHWNGHPFKC